MSIQSDIESKLTDRFQPSHLQVINESGNHNVPAGSESHFKVIIVSNEFDKQSLINRHRMVNQALATELNTKIHALAIHAYTPVDWSEKKQQTPDSPPCKGGDGRFA